VSSLVSRHCLNHLDCTGEDWIPARLEQFSRLPESEVVAEVASIDRLIIEIELRSNTTGLEYAKRYRTALMNLRRG
jgi:hypothetical protein